MHHTLAVALSFCIQAILQTEATGLPCHAIHTRGRPHTTPQQADAARRKRTALHAEAGQQLPQAATTISGDNRMRCSVLRSFTSLQGRHRHGPARRESSYCGTHRTCIVACTVPCTVTTELNRRQLTPQWLAAGCSKCTGHMQGCCRDSKACQVARAVPIFTRMQLRAATANNGHSMRLLHKCSDQQTAWSEQLFAAAATIHTKQRKTQSTWKATHEQDRSSTSCAEL
ncbi:hypothetical protein COO60DRAFT_1525069 [Scenedesmus sp. NREL 46B-D3]|nr:hypothetical protein COO60DRAFT_1525069 [Scenedesmus sp. NREL 46B-D3]